MRISTKIIAGYGILIALIAGLLAHQVVSIHRMQSIIGRLSDANLTAASTALDLMRDSEVVEEFTKKSFLFPADPDYRGKLQEYRTLFESDLRKMESSVRTKEEQAEIRRLSLFWISFTEELRLQQQAMQSQEAQDAPGALIDLMEQLRIQTDTVHKAVVAEIRSEVQASRQTGRMAETVSWIVAATALILSTLVSFLIVQSISTPLKQLTQGTRAIAEGKFFYRLDTSRRDEFAQLAKDFNSMTQRLNELDQMKKDFVSHVSHELKAPLASMQETIQLLLEQIPGSLNDKQRRLLELNLAGGQRLSAMIGNLLDLSRMEAGVMQYELKSNDLSDLVQTAVLDLQPQAGERDLSLAVEVPEQPLMVECDGDRIMQIIRNLVGNALKFSPKGKQICIRVVQSHQIPPGMPVFWRSKVPPPAEGSGFALITVTDSGPGVPDQHKAMIFEKFHQVQQGKKIPGQGAGLGLAISLTIAQAHRGAIWVEDNPGGGSIFFLLLPQGESSGQVSYRASSPI